MVLHELYDSFNIGVEVFNGYSPHDVSCIFSVWVLTVLVSQYKTSISLLNLSK